MRWTQTNLFRRLIGLTLCLLLAGMWACSDDSPGDGNESDATSEDAVDDSSGDSCEPGETRQEDCNTCTCDEDGQGWSCTELGCDIPDAGDSDTSDDDTSDETCEPGETRQEDCNTCSCQPDGKTWVCTEIGCDVPDAGDSDVADPDVTDPDAIDETCEPGETRQEDCNTCTCDEDGESWFCTELGCADDPCEGLSCGDSCQLRCPDNDPNCTLPAVETYCNEQGECDAAIPAC